MNIFKKYYYPHEVKLLSMNEKLVYMYAQSQWKLAHRGKFTMTLRDIVEATGMSESTVKRVLKELKAHDVLYGSQIPCEGSVHSQTLWTIENCLTHEGFVNYLDDGSVLLSPKEVNNFFGCIPPEDFIDADIPY